MYSELFQAHFGYTRWHHLLKQRTQKQPLSKIQLTEQILEKIQIIKNIKSTFTNVREVADSGRMLSNLVPVT